MEEEVGTSFGCESRVLWTQVEPPSHSLSSPGLVLALPSSTDRRMRLASFHILLYSDKALKDSVSKLSLSRVGRRESSQKNQHGRGEDPKEWISRNLPSRPSPRPARYPAGHRPVGSNRLGLADICFLEQRAGETG